MIMKFDTVIKAGSHNDKIKSSNVFPETREN
jgi:hypothetical protein